MGVDNDAQQAFASTLLASPDERERVLGAAYVEEQHYTTVSKISDRTGLEKASVRDRLQELESEDMVKSAPYIATSTSGQSTNADTYIFPRDRFDTTPEDYLDRVAEIAEILDDVDERFPQRPPQYAAIAGTFSTAVEQRYGADIADTVETYLEGELCRGNTANRSEEARIEAYTLSEREF